MSAPSTTTFYERKNNAVSTLLSTLAQGATSATLASGGGAKFPSSGTWFVTIWDDTTYPDNPSGDPNMEVVLVTSRSSDTLTITRAQSGTADVSHAAGSKVGLLIMDEALDQHETAINDLETVAYRTGWVAMGVTLTYSSVDNPTGVVTSSADISSILSVGMRIRFVNNGNTIYGIVTAISGTTITFLHEIDTATPTQALNIMANAAITSPFFSYLKNPYGFPSDPRKWTFQTSSVSDLSQASPTGGTWYNPGSYSLAIPIGAWRVSYLAMTYFDYGSATANVSSTMYATLSTANNSESDVDFTSSLSFAYYISGASSAWGTTFYREKFLNLSSKTSYYLNAKLSTTFASSIKFLGTVSKTITRCVCAYL